MGKINVDIVSIGESVLGERFKINVDNLELEELCALKPEDIITHPDRAFLTALIGIGNIHCRDVHKGVGLIKDSVNYGLDRSVAVNLLLRSLNVSMARSFASLGEDNRAIGKLIDFYLLGDVGSKVAFEETFTNLVSNVKTELADAASQFHSGESEFDKYCIKKYYTAREEYFHYDDSSEEDKWQLEVYLHAYYLMKKFGLSTVLDVGCGSGFKLIKYLGDFDTIGSELGVNLEMLQTRYPDRKWVESSFEKSNRIEADLIVCSDVIEHLVDPDDLLNWLAIQRPKYIILSTPDRDLVYKSGTNGRDGPPNNPAHVREWNYDEFFNYISKFFSVVEHKITNQKQATQMIVCKVK